MRILIATILLFSYQTHAKDPWTNFYPYNCKGSSFDNCLHKIDMRTVAVFRGNLKQTSNQIEIDFIGIDFSSPKHKEQIKTATVSSVAGISNAKLIHQEKLPLEIDGEPIGRFVNRYALDGAMPPSDDRSLIILRKVKASKLQPFERSNTSLTPEDIFKKIETKANGKVVQKKARGDTYSLTVTKNKVELSIATKWEPTKFRNKTLDIATCKTVSYEFLVHIKCPEMNFLISENEILKMGDTTKDPSRFEPIAKLTIEGKEHFIYSLMGTRSEILMKEKGKWVPSTIVAIFDELSI